MTAAQDRLIVLVREVQGYVLAASESAGIIARFGDGSGDARLAAWTYGLIGALSSIENSLEAKREEIE